MGQPERALEVREVYATIAELPEDFRLALVAVDVVGLSYREAARALRVREATITTRLYRAVKQLGDRLVLEPGGARGRAGERELRRRRAARRRSRCAALRTARGATAAIGRG